MHSKLFKAPSGASLAFTELGFGSAPIANLFRAVSDADADATMDAAWNAGIRYFDTAPLYGLGLSETRLNRFLRGKRRDDYLLSTKIGRVLEVCPPDQRTGIGKFFDTPSRKERFDYSYDGVMRSLEHSLERLGVDRIDILFAHDVDVFTHGSEEKREHYINELMTGGYKAMVKLRDEGVVKAIGAGVNETTAIEMMIARGDFDIFLLAGRYTLLEQDSLTTLMPLVQQRGIGLVIGGAYNSGILASGAKPGAMYNYDVAPQHILDRVARIETVCNRHGVKIVEAALRFPLAHPSVVTVIPGAAKPAEVDLNMATLAKSIPPALWKDLVGEGLVRQDAPLPQ